MFETAHRRLLAPPPGSANDPVTPPRSAESRFDPFTGNWTIFAPQRTERPDDFVEQTPSIKTDVQCPFCEGNESTTPPAVWTKHIPDTARLAPDGLDADDDDWSVRVVPNKFPAVANCDVDGDRDSDEPPGLRKRPSELFRCASVAGGHEVIIESPRHVHSVTQLDIAELDLVFQAYRDRIRHYRSIDGVRYVSVFKNVGRSAGASLTHSHSQLIATDQMPITVEYLIERMRRHRAATGCCLRCDLIRAERKAKDRVVACDETTITYCPYASHLPMMLRITSVEHQPCFEDLNDRALESVSRMLFRSVSWLERLRPGTAYNFCLNTRPPGIQDPTDSFHWSLDVFPRMTQIAGFEWSSGCMINPILPETAAGMFRRCAASENPRRRR